MWFKIYENGDISLLWCDKESNICITGQYCFQIPRVFSTIQTLQRGTHYLKLLRLKHNHRISNVPTWVENGSRNLALKVNRSLCIRILTVWNVMSEGRESWGTLNQEWLCWRGTAAIFQNRPYVTSCGPVKIHRRFWEIFMNLYRTTRCHFQKIVLFIATAERTSNPVWNTVLFNRDLQKNRGLYTMWKLVYIFS
jgi:hypothetical protein